MPAVVLHMMSPDSPSQLTGWDKPAVHTVVNELVAKTCQDVPAFIALCDQALTHHAASGSAKAR